MTGARACGLLLASIVFDAAAARAATPDHLACYKINDPGAAASYTADLDGLAPEPGCVVRTPARLGCVPATKTNVTPPLPGSDTAVPNPFVCYKVKCAKRDLPPLGVNDQFGARTLAPRRSRLLCAPAAPTTTTVFPGTTTTTTTPPGCYCDASGCCQPFNGGCFIDVNCCRGSCASGRCACAFEGSACATSAECCLGVCDATGHCACVALGASCTRGFECCSGVCDPTGHCACQSAGGACRQSGDCCSGTCTSGRCGCTPTAGSCAQDGDCCSGSCDTTGHCACLATGAACGLGASCCSGLCDGSGHCVDAATSPTHLECYRVDDPQARTSYTADVGGLVPAPGCVVHVPAGIACVPTTKANVSPTPPGGGGTGIPNPFVCYRLRCPKEGLPEFPAADQFGSRTLQPKATSLLCAPAAAGSTTTVTVSTSTTTTTKLFCLCGTAGCCLGGSQGCVADADCCSDICDPTGHCGCLKPGTPCSLGPGCCSGTCSAGQCSCELRGTLCSGDADCCSGICDASGRCSCLLPGAACSPDGGSNTCCSGFCQAGQCICSEVNFSCRTDAECCSGVCNPSRGACG